MGYPKLCVNKAHHFSGDNPRALELHFIHVVPDQAMSKITQRSCKK
jgi:hypothetical protein